MDSPSPGARGHSECHTLFVTLRMAQCVRRLATLVVATPLLLGPSASGALSQEVASIPRRDLTLLVGHNGSALGFALEGDFFAVDGFTMLASIQRWSFSRLCAGLDETPPLIDEPAPLTPSRPYCSPDGWGLSLGVRATVPEPHRLAPFIQGEIGLYRFDGGGTTTRQGAARAGVSIAFRSGPSIELGGEVRAMVSYEWSGARQPAEIFGVWQLGMGFPFR